MHPCKVRTLFICIMAPCYDPVMVLIFSLSAVLTLSALTVCAAGFVAPPVSWTCLSYLCPLTHAPPATRVPVHVLWTGMRASPGNCGITGHMLP